MLKLILKDGKVITGKDKKELEINMKNDSVFTVNDTLGKYKKGVAERVFQMYGFMIDTDNLIDSLVKYNLARLEEVPEA